MKYSLRGLNDKTTAAQQNILTAKLTKLRSVSSILNQAVLQLPLTKQLLACELMQLFYSLSEHFSLLKPMNELRGIQSEIKNLFFVSPESMKLSFCDEAGAILLSEIVHNTFTGQLATKVLNSMEAYGHNLKLNNYSDLNLFLDSLGGNLAKIAVFTLFPEDYKTTSFEFSESLSMIGKAIFWLNLLKNFRQLTQRNLIVVPLDNLYSFQIARDSILQPEYSPQLKQLSSFTLKKLLEMIQLSRKDIPLFPKNLRDCLTVITDKYYDEVSTLLRTDWSFAEPVREQKKGFSWFIGKVQNLQPTRVT
jgi:hypothetical protein